MKKRIKLIAYILSCVMGLTGCKMNFQDTIKKDYSKNDTSDSTTSQTNSIESTSGFTEFIENLISFNEPEQTDPVPTEVEITEPEIITDDILIATTDVNIRANSSTDALVIGNLQINETAIRILSSDNGWELVKTNDKIGYISSDYLQTTGDTVEREFEHTLKNDIVLTTTDLNFRTGPSTDYEVIKTFKINTELRVVAEVDNGWLLVQHNDKLGYISSTYTTSLLEKAQQQYPELGLTELNIEKIIYSTGEGVNFRNDASTEADILDSLSKLESTRVLGEYDNWYFVMGNDYNFGFISKDYAAELNGIFVIVDLSEQRAYLYKNNQLYCVAPVTTGKDSTPSDIGLFEIWYKGTYEEITPGYVVDYWMPYNRGEGLHDAERWREVYGMHTEEEKAQQSYRWNGSNGCINMEKANAKIMYETTSIGTPVLVHK